MKVVTEAGLMVCAHETGHVHNRPGQQLVRVAGSRVLVENDPEGRDISACSNFNPPLGIKPCLKTLRVDAGYSALVRIDGRRICLDSVTGYTDGMPSGTVKYHVRDAGQALAGSTS